MCWVIYEAIKHSAENSATCEFLAKGASYVYISNCVYFFLFKAVQYNSIAVLSVLQ